MIKLSPTLADRRDRNIEYPAIPESAKRNIPNTTINITGPTVLKNGVVTRSTDTVTVPITKIKNGFIFLLSTPVLSNSLWKKFIS